MADKEYRYYKDNGKLMRLHIEQDDEPLDPRYDWDGQIGKMMCWHRYYRLGDYKDNDYNDNEEDRKSTRLNSSHTQKSRMPSSA